MLEEENNKILALFYLGVREDLTNNISALYKELYNNYSNGAMERLHEFNIIDKHVMEQLEKYINIKGE